MVVTCWNLLSIYGNFRLDYNKKEANWIIENIISAKKVVTFCDIFRVHLELNPHKMFLVI
jgi:hypothetical protein